MPIDRSYVSIAADGSHVVNNQRSGGLPDVTPSPLPKTPINLRYPNGSGGLVGQKPYEKWILFEVKAGRHILRNQTLGEGAENVDRTLASVALYLPDSALSSDMVVRYAESPLGEVAGPLLEAAVQTGKAYREIAAINADKSMTKWDEVKAGISSIASTAGLVLNELADAAKGRMAVAAQSALNAVAKGSGDAAEILLGKTVNPRTDLMFKSVEYRTHSLNFTLVPRTKAEADEIDRIVSLFQYYMLPSYGSPQQQGASQFLIGYPYEFEVRMFSEFNDLSKHHINTIGRSVLRTVSITSAPDGRVAFIEKDGEYYPAATTLKLDLQEVRLLGRDSTEIVRGGAQPFDDPRL